MAAPRPAGSRFNNLRDEPVEEIHRFASLTTGSSRGRRHETLRLLDARGLEIREAIGPAWPPDRTGSFATPRPFVVEGGDTFWIKPQAQEGLGQELFGGRLAAALGVGPPVAVVDVSILAVPPDGSLNRFLGTMLGIGHLAGVENARDLGPAVRGGVFLPTKIDMVSWAAVAAFQTWINAEDNQVFVGLGDGVVHSADHGGCFKSLLPGPPQRIVTPDIPGFESVRCDWSLLEGPAQRIASLAETVLLEAASNIPETGPWRTSFARRIATVEWLIKRQPDLQDILRRWSTWVS